MTFVKLTLIGMATTLTLNANAESIIMMNPMPVQTTAPIAIAPIPTQSSLAPAPIFTPAPTIGVVTPILMPVPTSAPVVVPPMPIAGGGGQVCSLLPDDGSADETYTADTIPDQTEKVITRFKLNGVTGGSLSDL